jgi:uroporphyrinogen-III synthase
VRLLVTRPEPDASALADELRRLGHEPVVQPLLEFGVLDFDLAPIQAADGLIFTSGNALRALSQMMEGAAISGCPVYCVGAETERRLREAGFKTIMATADTAEALAAKIVAATSKGAKLVHVTGEHQAFDLAGALKREGLSICTLSVYCMQARRAFDSCIADEIGGGEIGGVILMSPRTADVFVMLCERHGLSSSAKSLHYYCLASSVAKELKRLDPVYVHVAAKPSRAALLALLPELPTPGQDRVK